jgi:predicted ATPase/DNA-binding winged helix-turn-helix (wHTH) protein
MGRDGEGERIYRFDHFQLLPRRRCLLYRDGAIKLGPRAMSVLIALVERHDRVVTTDEILDLAWPGVTVEPVNVAVQICHLREVLGSEAIATIPGRGYRFMAKVEPPDAVSPATPAPVWSVARPRSNLPLLRAGLIGRETELIELAECCARDRLVTLVGPGGIGKTRLALETGARIASDFEGGVWLIDLAPLIDPTHVASATATVLEVPLHNGDTPVETIVAAIRERRMLLIFDNCEYQLAAATSLIEGLLGRAADLSVLVTSQEALGLAVERSYRLGPLAVPPPGATDIAGFGAVDLFVERARVARRHFQLDAGNAAAVAEICRRLDGIPLALEMAASRLPLLGLDGLCRRLGERLTIFGTHPRTGEPRHRTLRALVEWSHGLLDPAEQQVFRRLAVFPCNFSLEAAIAVASTPGDEPWSVAEVLSRLIDKSLVTIDIDEPPRYRLLETLRLHAAEKLERSGESDAASERHARYFTEFFDGADDARETISDFAWRGIYQPEIDNVRAALDWTLADQARKHGAIAITAATAILWAVLGLRTEGRHYFDRVEGLVDQNTPDGDRARFLRWSGDLWVDFDLPRGLALLERSVTIYRRLDQPLRLAMAVTQMAHNYVYQGRYADARAALSEAEEILSTLGYRRKALPSVVNSLGFLAANMDDTIDARRYFGRALDLSRAAHDVAQEGYCLAHLAEFEFKMGAVGVAVERAREAVSAFRSVQHSVFLGTALVNLTAYLLAQDNLTEARALAEEALSLVRDRGGLIVFAHLQQWALLAAIDGRYEGAARLAGYIDAGYAASGQSREPTEQNLYDRLSTLLSTSLSPKIILTHASEGAGWNEDQAMNFVYDRLISTGQNAS